MKRTIRMTLTVVALLTWAAAGLAAAADHPEEPTSGVGDPADLEPRVTLKWEARQEGGVYGYLVYRSDRRQGPYLRISSEIIHAQGAVEETARYRFVDTDVEPGKTYYYYLDTISKGGFKQRFSGVVTKTVDAG